MKQTDGQCVVIEQYENEELYCLPSSLTAYELKELVFLYFGKIGIFLSFLFKIFALILSKKK